MPDQPLKPQQLAEACVDAIQANDNAVRLLGIEVIEVQPGNATVCMTITEEMTNSHNNCHGGLIFTLADAGFAFACNNANQMTVASGCSIEFIAPATIGDRLTAVVRERSRSRRTGVYDAEITNQRKELVALFRGKSYQIRGQIIPQTGIQT